MTKSLSVLLVAALLLIMQPPALSQEQRTPVTIGEVVRSYSEVMEEERVVIVHTPLSYNRTEENLPVLYLLDGGWHFLHTVAVTEFLAVNLYTPQMIVIGINSPDRGRDLTPPSEDPAEIGRNPAHGGAEKFQRYLEEELMPWVEQNYRVHPYRILVGHSLGGLFAIQSLITKPALFDAYLAISPSMQWSHQGVASDAAAFFGKTEQLSSTFYMTAANEGKEMLEGVRKLAGVLNTKAPKGFSWSFEHMPQETHGSIPLVGIYEGLEFIFEDWALREPYEVYDKFGIDAIERFHSQGSERYGFERDFPVTTFGTLITEAIYRENFDGAIEVMDKFHDSVDSPVSYYVELLANALRDANRRDEAVRYYREILVENPENQNARETLSGWDVEL